MNGRRGYEPRLCDDTDPSKILFVINNPEVYKSPNSNTYM